MSDKLDILNGLVDELMKVLDEDILRISSFLQQLDQLRASVIKRDEEALKILLEAVGSEESDYQRLEDKRHNIRIRLSKVIGCDDPDGLHVAQVLYGNVVAKTVPVSSTRTAEATKLVENIYRSVNIALVNELAKHGISVARCTVTKYRKAMNIPSSRQRRQWGK